MQSKEERLARNCETGSEKSVICAKGIRDWERRFHWPSVKSHRAVMWAREPRRGWESLVGLGCQGLLWSLLSEALELL